MLSVQNLCKDYPTRTGPVAILCGNSFELQHGESLAVTGPSGLGTLALVKFR